MSRFRIRDQPKSVDSPKAEVGEIDTRAPFQSVKAALSLFGGIAALSKGKQPAAVKKKSSSESLLDKETQFLLAQRELYKIKQRMESAENTKSRALSELAVAKRTVEDLTSRLRNVSEAKQSVIEATEAIKQKAKELEVAKTQKDSGDDPKKEVDHEREQYRAVTSKLDAAKQELTKIRQDFNAVLEAKLMASQQAAEAQRAVQENTEKVHELSEEISAMQQSIQQLKLASVQDQEKQAKIAAENEAHIQACKTAREEVEKKLLSMKKECDPELTRDLEVKLEETTEEIEVLQEEMKRVHASRMDAVRVVTTELNVATKTLQDIAEEENSLRCLVTSLRMELENVRKEHAELEEKEAEKEAAAKENDKQILKLQQLVSETENVRKEAENTRKNAERLKQDAATAKNKTQELEKQLQLALREAEEAKTAEKQTTDEMKRLSERRDSATSDTFSTIKISREEFENLNRKVGESQEWAEMKIAAAAAELEAINANESAAYTKLEGNLKAVEEIKEATEMALKAAEMADAAQKVVEGELQKWRQEEHTIEDQAVLQIGR